jgi:LDH2 family malate/lactate/ureidoglycolate dehydrogenase
VVRSKLHHRVGKSIPVGWGLDAEGQPTTNAGDALAGAMLAFGGHKGSALAAMVELLAGPLIGAQKVGRRRLSTSLCHASWFAA